MLHCVTLSDTRRAPLRYTRPGTECTGRPKCGEIWMQLHNSIKPEVNLEKKITCFQTLWTPCISKFLVQETVGKANV